MAWQRAGVPGSLIGGDIVKPTYTQGTGMAGADLSALPGAGGGRGAAIGGKSASGGRTDIPHRRVEVSVLRCARRSLHVSPAPVGAEIVQHDNVAFFWGVRGSL
jgi:hypothetical protein